MTQTIYPKVSVVIPTHNDWEYTRECLQALTQVSYPNLELLLVDDGSTDGTAEHVAQSFPHVRVLPGDGNLWWTGSMNLGLQDALARGADYVMALNNDVLVAPEAVSALVECAQKNKNAIVGSLIYKADEPDMIWCAGGALRWPWPGEIMLGNGERDVGQYEGIRRVKWTPGMGTLMARDILLELNLYDARHMPQYIADADFTLRAGRAGHPVLVTSESKLYNHVENTGGITTDKQHITWLEFISIFTSLRSADYLPARLVFIFRHCPKRWLLPALFIRYSRLLGYGLKRMAR